ncbi:hypothetical protein ACWC10_15500 [Streptomyces sp. NPDC001595]|uniref:hypothetical protein n=1 Tax=Streptomyces sp. NPDC001532 TaxID=3154520 RepID=UPI003316CF43
MTTHSTRSSLPSVALRGRSGSAWLEGDAVHLEQGGVRRRIPLAAVERAETEGAAARTVGSC